MKKILLAYGFPLLGILNACIMYKDASNNTVILTDTLILEDTGIVDTTEYIPFPDSANHLHELPKELQKMTEEAMWAK